jgi:hypothetical protein
MTNFNILAKDLHNEFILSNIIKTKLTILLIFINIYMIILNINILLISSMIAFIIIFKIIEEFNSNKKFIKNINNLANKYNINHNFKSYYEITSYINKNQT